MSGSPTDDHGAEQRRIRRLFNRAVGVISALDVLRAQHVAMRPKRRSAATKPARPTRKKAGLAGATTFVIGRVGDLALLASILLLFDGLARWATA